MALLFTVVLVSAAGNTAMQSVMPSIGTALGVADVWISLAYSWSALLWVIFAPYWASRSDRRGRKAMMALGLAGFVASMGLCGAVLWIGLAGWLTPLLTLLLFALCRSLYGLLGSAAPPAVQAYVASRTPRAERTQALSLISSSFGLGTVIGPALAPLLIFPLVGLTGPFFSFAVIGIVAMVALRLRLPNDEPRFAARGLAFDAPYGGSGAGRHATDKPSDEDADTPAGQDTSLPAEAPALKWADKRIRPWLLAGLLGGHAQAMMLGIAGFLVLDRLGLRDDPLAGAGPVSIVLMIGAVATLLAQWGLIPILHLGPRVSTLAGRSSARRAIFTASRWALPSPRSASACSGPVSPRACRLRSAGPSRVRFRARSPASTARATSTRRRWACGFMAIATGSALPRSSAFAWQ